MIQIFRLAILIFIFQLSISALSAQVAINEDNSEPDASAMLDVSSADKGLLIPRMDSTSRNNIFTPAEGLMVFDSTTNSFWYYTNGWQEIGGAFSSKNGLTSSKNNENSFLFGADSLNFNSEIPETKIFLDKNTPAFRVGFVGTESWDQDSLGIFSIGIGENVKATGSTATALGKATIASGNSSIALGSLSEASGDFSTVLGTENIASGKFSTAFGRYNEAPSYGEVVIGFFNTDYVPNHTSDFDANDRLFVIGNGESGSRSDALRIYKNGKAELNGALTIDSAYTFPVVDGDSLQVLGTDGNGNLAWLESTDNQTLVFENDSLSILNGNTVDLSKLKTVDSSGLKLIVENNEYLLDIEQTSGANTFGSTTNIWQSITPNYTSYLRQLDLKFTNGFTAGELRFYEGEGTNGNLIYSKDIENITQGFRSFDLSDNPPLVTSGNSYTFQVVANEGSFYVSWESGNVYSGGRARIGENADLLFRTYYTTTLIDTINIISLNTKTQDSAYINIQYLDTLLFSDGTTQSTASAFRTKNGITSSVNNTDDFLFGTDAVNHTSSTEYKLFFNTSNGAFRAGTVTNSNWDDSNQGTYSFASGLNSKASGLAAIAFGTNTNAVGDESVAFGNICSANGANSFVAGILSAANGSAAVAFGNSNTSEGNFSFTSGVGLEASSFAETVFGAYNTSYTANSTSSKNDNDRLFVLGNGTDANNTSDALVIYKDGEAELNGALKISNSDGSGLSTKALLEIDGVGPTVTTNGDLAFYAFDGWDTNISTLTHPYSIYASGRVAAFIYHAISDERVKDIKGISDSKADLETLQKIQITDYQFKDQLQNGDEQQKKVIAQQVAEVYPQAVKSNTTEVIPDIYQKARVKDGWIELATNLKVGEKVKIITQNSNVIHEVTAVANGRFQVAHLSIKDKELAMIFVYGRQVNDFHTVDYEAIAMLNVSATQEQQRIIEAQQKRIEVLEKEIVRIQELEKMMNQLQAQISSSSEVRNEN